MGNLNVRYHRDQGHICDAEGRTVSVTYNLEEWEDKETGSTIILGSIGILHGLSGDLYGRRFVLLLATQLALRCSLQPMGRSGTYEVVPIGGFIQL